MRRYVSLLRDHLGEDLLDVVLFGSAARGEMWPPTSAMHSDIDLLVLTRAAVSEVEQDALINETYPLFLECGRQLSPAFMSRDRWERQLPRDRALRSEVERDGQSVLVTSSPLDGIDRGAR
jgi:predicted nucleotidyltransferase